MHHFNPNSSSQKNVSGKLICRPVVLTGVLTRLQFVVITVFSVKTLTFDGVWLCGEEPPVICNPTHVKSQFSS